MEVGDYLELAKRVSFSSSFNLGSLPTNAHINLVTSFKNGSVSVTRS